MKKKKEPTLLMRAGYMLVMSATFGFFGGVAATHYLGWFGNVLYLISIVVYVLVSRKHFNVLYYFLDDKNI